VQLCRSLLNVISQDPYPLIFPWYPLFTGVPDYSGHSE